jgi:magnesium-transporting ATPase (P-type)
MDWYTVQGRQGLSDYQLESKQIKAMFLSVIVILVLIVACVSVSQDFSFLDNNFIIVVFGSVWVPQVIVNFRYGWGDVPTFRYAVAVTVNLLYMPLYFKWNPNNFMHLEPVASSDRFWPLLFFTVIILQLASLWT